MSRSYRQIIQSKEDNIFNGRDSDTGTSSVSVTPDAGKSVFVTDIQASNIGTAILSVLDGTAFLYRTSLPHAPSSPFVHPLQTPLKGSVGTVVTAKIEGIKAVSSNINIEGYTA